MMRMRLTWCSIFIASVRMPKRNLPNLKSLQPVKAYRVYFKKNGINLTKLVYAESLLDVIHQFKKMEVILIKQIDMLPDGEIDVISLN
jgi:hypothetical protein